MAHRAVIFAIAQLSCYAGRSVMICIDFDSITCIDFLFRSNNHVKRTVERSLPPKDQNFVRFSGYNTSCSV